MQILSVFLIPAAFMYYTAGCRDADAFTNRLAYFAGIAAGILALLVSGILSPVFPVSSSSFAVHFLGTFLFESLIPFAGGIALLWFVFTSDNRARLSRVRPNLFGIATVLLPALTLGAYNLDDAWAVVLVPSMILSVIFLADYSIGRRVAVNGNPDSIDVLEALALPGVALLVSDLCKTLWFFHFPFWSYAIPSLSVVGLAFFLRVRKYW